MIVCGGDSLQSGLPERCLPTESAEYSRTRQTGDNRRSPGPKIIATRPYACGCTELIVGTLGIMATRVAKGTPRPRADAPGGQARPAAGQGRSQDGQARSSGGTGRSASGRAASSANAMPAPPRQRQSRNTSSRSGQSRSGQSRSGQNRSGQNRRGQNRPGQGRKRAGGQGRRPRGAAARPPQRTADPILILAGWLGRLVAGLWMVAAHAAGFGARRFGRSARDLDPLHQRDGVGLAFLAAAIVVAATTWFHMHNFAGRMLADLFLGAFGSAAWTVPLLLGLLAWRFLRHPDRNAQTGRMVIGWTCLLLGGLGLVHIAAGTPQPSRRGERHAVRRRADRLLRVGPAGGRADAVDRRAAARAGQRVRAAGDHRDAGAPGARPAGRTARLGPAGRRRRPGGRRRRCRGDRGLRDGLARCPGAAADGPRPSRPASTTGPYDTPILGEGPGGKAGTGRLRRGAAAPQPDAAGPPAEDPDESLLDALGFGVPGAAAPAAHETAVPARDGGAGERRPPGRRGRTTPRPAWPGASSSP